MNAQRLSKEKRKDFINFIYCFFIAMKLMMMIMVYVLKEEIYNRKETNLFTLYFLSFSKILSRCLANEKNNF